MVKIEEQIQPNMKPEGFFKNVVIREAYKQDVELLKSIEVRDGFDYPYKKAIADYLKYMDEGTKFFIAETKGIPVGYISIKNSDYIRYGVRIHFLAVVKDAQRMGVGTELITYVEQTAKKRGLHRIFINVYDNNLVAEEFYQKRGYKFWFEIPYLYERGISARVYYKDVGLRFAKQKKAYDKRKNKFGF
ncbi:MAG: hypothetical protein CVU81_02115 [Euryarchaeota archaeon HGW-Euryarchaeota-1]|nr:MAG: hypothetical protein CVU81_02115 [Euryarchaeota archaeon HGW-Euryarchaeota-1]